MKPPFHTMFAPVMKTSDSPLVDLNQVIKAIADEPEFPDEMPDELWKLITSDKAIATLAFQQTVSMTKWEITQRILAL
jgi:hypothetical protein